ncbi:MAG: hypothetical protein DRZ76_02405 [Candidatus Nealsonbacteria bacterium]|nr:MAG: hypothetical protein DRZ76_02405 [Candidatus Nealsonbacteria bacterium]
MKKIILPVITLIFLFGGFNFALAQDVEIDFFYSPICPHCAREKVFLEELESEYPQIKINRYDVINSQENQRLLGEFYEKYKMPESLQGLVPATFTSEKYFIGFDDKIAEEMKNCLEECLRPGKEEFSLTHTSIIKKSIKIPLLGEIKLSNLSFPLMAAVLGFLDGVNICSLGALILILSLVLALDSRKKIIIFGGVYILTTALIYGFLIFFWYKLFEILAPYLKIMNLLIGILGIGGGIYFFRQFWKSRKSPPTCESEVGGKISSKFLPKLQKLLKKPSSLLLAAGAVFAFAFVVTLVEFPCSAVVPVAFTAVLAQAGLPWAVYLLYIAIFVLFYLLDEIIVFLIAVFTSKIWLTSPKFLKWILFLEAVILLSLGFYYLFSLL